MPAHERLEAIANQYHLSDAIPDKFIEDACQRYCCEWIGLTLARKDRVLELGYGDGITASALSKLVDQYTIVEGAPSLQLTARRALPTATVIDSLFEDFSPSCQYDKLLALHVLEHVADPRTILTTMRGWLSSEGELIVVVPNQESLHRQLAVLMELQPRLDSLSKRDELVGHLRVYDLPTLRADLITSGFEIIEEKGFFLKPLPNSMMLTFPSSLIDALNRMSEQLPSRLLANIGIRANLSSQG